MIRYSDRPYELQTIKLRSYFSQQDYPKHWKWSILVDEIEYCV